MRFLVPKTAQHHYTSTTMFHCGKTTKIYVRTAETWYHRTKRATPTVSPIFQMFKPHSGFDVLLCEQGIPLSLSDEESSKQPSRGSHFSNNSLWRHTCYYFSLFSSPKCCEVSTASTFAVLYSDAIYGSSRHSEVLKDNLPSSNERPQFHHDISSQKENLKRVSEVT